ncbi:hypothetical protein NP233_g10522 [Leucocoprinus birnbaumii]|uniref:Uncharacterized protein n=1 Tax=Leucocoprinus birnbaumii TaxID=56174 RepID=A0AAD5VIM2_9AGAR|nr:hypothetical protein NP233_g10522 [Leucocoprinus birnbaumii]
MPELLGDEILPILGALEALALVDLEQGVRDIAIAFLPKILGQLSPQPHLVDDLNRAVSQLLSSTFRRRMTFASCQRSTFLASIDAGQKPSVALTDEMLRMIFDLSQDSVADVRISVARFVGSVCDEFVRESEPIPSLLAEIIQRLSQDSSLSVKIYIPDPATLLGGQQSVTFPSFGDVVEPLTPGQPSRSRHFSKPPLSRLNSSASITDLTGSGVQPMELDTNVVVDRLYGGADSHNNGGETGHT